MTKLNFDVDAFELLQRAEANPDAAAQVLLIAAGYIRAGKAMPDFLVDHIAGAIEASMIKPQEVRASSFARELHLTARNKRPSDVDWFQLGRRYDELVQMNPADKSVKTATRTQLAVEFGIDERTVQRIYDEKYLPALAAKKEADKGH